MGLAFFFSFFLKIWIIIMCLCMTCDLENFTACDLLIKFWLSVSNKKIHNIRSFFPLRKTYRNENKEIYKGKKNQKMIIINSITFEFEAIRKRNVWCFDIMIKVIVYVCVCVNICFLKIKHVDCTWKRMCVIIKGKSY